MIVIDHLPEKLILTYSWATAINKAQDGTELQRVCTRLYPLITISVEYKLDEGFKLQSLRDELFLNPGDPVEIPFRHEAMLVTANVTSTTARVPQVGSKDWAIAGRRVYVEKDEGEDGYDATISSVTTSGSDYVLTLSASPPSTYPASTTRVCPLLTVYPDEGPGLGSYRLQGGVYTLTGRVNLFAAMGLDYYPTSLYEGMMIVTTPFIQGEEPVSEEYASGLVSVGTTPFESVTYWTQADIIKSLVFEGGFLDAPLDWCTWKTFLTTMRGQQVAFLLSSQREDFTIIGAGGINIEAHTGYDLSAWLAVGSHNRVAVYYENGDIDYRTIDHADNNGNGNYTIELTVALSRTDAVLISWLSRVRLASDDVTATFLPGGEFSVALQVRSVQQ